MAAPMNAPFALDMQGLAALQAQSRTAPQQSLKQAAKQFEAVFMNMLLKSMRETISQDGLTDNEATRTYTGMLDQQLAQNLSGKGLGLAEIIEKQLSRGMAGAGKDGAVTPVSSELKALLDRIQSNTNAAASPDTAPQAQDFVRKLLPQARAVESATGIPARFVLAQAALESGWGKSEIRAADGTPSRNLFGIKAGPGWNGAVVDTPTTEYIDGEPRQVVQRFRAYGSYAESFADYARLIATNPRYQNVLAQGHDAAGFASALQRAGYATDPEYADKIAHIIQTKFNGALA